MLASGTSPASHINVPRGCTMRYAASDRSVAATSSFLSPNSGIGSAILRTPQSKTYIRTVFGGSGRACALVAWRAPRANTNSASSATAAPTRALRVFNSILLKKASAANNPAHRSRVILDDIRGC